MSAQKATAALQFVVQALSDYSVVLPPSSKNLFIQHAQLQIAELESAIQAASASEASAAGLGHAVLD